MPEKPERTEQTLDRKTVPITYIITFLGFLDTHLLIPVISLYALSLGADVGVIGLIIGIYSVANTPANILFGRLIDRVGYKVPLTIGLAGDALGMFLYTLCRLPVHLALVRAFHGISGGLVGPATMSVTAGFSERTGKGRAMALYGISLAAATLVGYGLSGLIAARLGYSAVFVFGAILLAAGVILSFLLPDNKKWERNQDKVAPPGQTLRQIRGLLGRKGLSLAYASIFAQYFTFGGVVTLLPVYVSNLGMGAFHVGMLLATFALAFVLLQFPSGVISDKAGRLLPTIIGQSLAIISLVILPSLSTFPLLVMVMVLYGIAYGTLFPSISALVADFTLPEERGAATGLFHALLTAGVAIGAPVMGWVGGLAGVGWGLASSSLAIALALAVALATSRRT